VTESVCLPCERCTDHALPLAGINEDELQLAGEGLRLCDTGGTRFERKRWIHCFEGVDVLIFVVRLDSYDMVTTGFRAALCVLAGWLKFCGVLQVLIEDEGANRMSEQLTLWGGMAVSRWFKKIPKILLFTCYDRLLLKRQTVTLTVCPEFADARPDDSLAYIVSKFERVSQSSQSPVHYVVANTTDHADASRAIDLMVAIARRSYDRAGSDAFVDHVVDMRITNGATFALVLRSYWDFSAAVPKANTPYPTGWALEFAWTALDDKATFERIQRAAADRDPSALLALTICYEKGICVAASPVVAFVLAKEAVLLGSQEAEVFVGRFTASGFGTRQDVSGAIALLEKVWPCAPVATPTALTPPPPCALPCSGGCAWTSCRAV
jgi:hypothetical protein